jgi:hypothetical protein
MKQLSASSWRPCDFPRWPVVSVVSHNHQTVTVFPVSALYKAGAGNSPWEPDDGFLSTKNGGRWMQKNSRPRMCVEDSGLLGLAG